MQRTSADGKTFIAREEGVLRYAYNDPVGNATFGVGHLIHLGNVTPQDRAKWGTKAHPKSLEFTMQIFANDLKPYEDVVRNAARREMYQHRFDACVSLAFNIGTGGFAGSTVARELRANHPARAADAFLLWSRAGNDPDMLRPRRIRERRLFLTGDYTP